MGGHWAAQQELVSLMKGLQQTMRASNAGVVGVERKERQGRKQETSQLC